MADKFYLIRSAVNTGSIKMRSDVLTGYDFLKVTGTNVAIVDSLLASIDDDNWMSCDIADAITAEGYQADGITLPKKAIDS